MKKFLKKNKSVVAELFTYFMMFLVGMITLMFPGWGFTKPALYTATLFVVVAFFSFGGYFFTKDDKVTYELLIFSLINIIASTYFFVFGNKNLSTTLGTGFLIFSILSSLNRAYYIMQLDRKSNELSVLRAIALILLLFISVLTIQNFYRSYSEVQTIIIGYYFLTYGIIAFIEILLFITISPRDFKRFVDGDFSINKLRSINKLDDSADKLEKIVKSTKKRINKKLHK